MIVIYVDSVVVVRGDTARLNDRGVRRLQIQSHHRHSIERLHYRESPSNQSKDRHYH